METLCVNTPIGVLTVEVTGNSFSTAGGISVYLQDSDANLYPLVATEFNSGNNALETTVFQDQEHIEEPVEIKHSGLPETDNPYENRVVKAVTMLEYLKQMHPTFQKSIENIQEITEDPLRYFCKQEAETLLDNRKNHEKHGKMVKELQEKLLDADHFNNLDWECSIADEVSDSYELQMRELLSDDEDEYIMEFSHTGNPYVVYHCIANKTTDDIGGFLEDTLHRILDHNGTSGDVFQLLGAYIPDEKQQEEFDKTEEYTYLDLGYVIPGLIMYTKAEE